MQRIIKFRGKSIKQNKFAYGMLTYDVALDCYKIIENNSTVYEIQIDKYVVDKETIGQFTGLKDKNGVDVYEGDLLDFDEYEFGRKITPSIVRWDNKNSCFDFGVGLPKDVSLYRKVIGNIHEVTE